MQIKILLIFALFLSIVQPSKMATPCNFCHLMVNSVQKSTPAWPLLPMLERIALEYCVRKHLQDSNVCKGAIKEMTTYILKGLWRHFTNPHIVCQDLLLCRKEYVKRDLETDIASTIRDKPDKVWEKPSGRRTLKVVHISDLHPDLLYTEGSPVDCCEPVCCRANVPVKNNSTRKAGYWGSLGQCQIPMQTYELLLKQISKLKPDAIIWTGDNTPHDIWRQTQSYNINYTVILAEKMRTALNCTVIPAMGNHESYPVNIYDYSHTERQTVLNRGLAQAWKQWLDQKALAMQREKGHFSMTYPHLNNLKVISINTQAGNKQNWLLLQDISDPGDVLKWIESELKESEKAGQKVYLIGHIPPKSNLNDWSMRFNAIVDRYAYIIRGQFYGHTHNDQLQFMPSMKNTDKISQSKLSSYCLIVPSIATGSTHLPQFRVLDIDYDTLQVVDYAQYRLDIRKYQTKQQIPQFQLFYRFKEAFQVSDMTIQGGITEVRNKIRDDPGWQKLYEYHRCGGLCEGKDGMEVFCSTMSAPQLESQCLGQNYKKSMFEKLAGPWRQFKHKKL